MKHYVALLLVAAALSGGGVGMPVMYSIDAVVRHRHFTRATPLRGVGGSFIIAGIAVLTLMLLHGLLHGVGARKAAVAAVVAGDSDGYSEVWFGSAGDGASTMSNAESFQGFGKRLRHTLSFQLPGGSWHHTDSNPSRSRDVPSS